jgi:translation initiation factor 1
MCKPRAMRLSVPSSSLARVRRLGKPEPGVERRRVADMTARNSRLVYSTDKGRTCPTCGWPIDNCQCSSRLAAEPVPARITARLRMEKKGRGGKTMTVIDGLPRNEEFLKALCAELKRLAGTGGAVAEGAIELQGDLRERLRAHLVGKGYIVKG